MICFIMSTWHIVSHKKSGCQYICKIMINTFPPDLPKMDAVRKIAFNKMLFKKKSFLKNIGAVFFLFAVFKCIKLLELRSYHSTIMHAQ